MRTKTKNNKDVLLETEEVVKDIESQDYVVQCNSCMGDVLFKFATQNKRFFWENGKYVPREIFLCQSCSNRMKQGECVREHDYD